MLGSLPTSQSTSGALFLHGQQDSHKSSSTRERESQIPSQKRRMLQMEDSTYGVFDCEFCFHSHEWSCSKVRGHAAAAAWVRTRRACERSRGRRVCRDVHQQLLHGVVGRLALHALLLAHVAQPRHSHPCAGHETCQHHARMPVNGAVQCSVPMRRPATMAKCRRVNEDGVRGAKPTAASARSISWTTTRPERR